MYIARIHKCGTQSLDYMYKGISHVYTQSHHVNSPGGMPSNQLVTSHVIDTDHCRWSQMYKVGFVRNPFSRIVSLYHNKISTRVSPTFKHFVVDTLTGMDVYTPMILDHNNLIRVIDDLKLHCSGLMNPHYYVSSLDFVGKVENFQQDVDTINRQMNIPDMKLSHVNRSKHKHYTEYYDDETREIVAEKYAKDIEHFGYKFEE